VTWRPCGRRWGDDRLTFYGRSYGTLIGQQYAETFPDRVRAIALDGVTDHSLDTQGYWDTTAAAVQDSFDEFVQWNQRTPASALRGRDVRALWHDLLERAERGQLPSPMDPARPARPEELVTLAYSHFNGPRWAELAKLLAMLAAGEPIPATEQAPAPPTGQGSAVVPFPPLIWCADWSLPVDDNAELAGHLRRTAQIAPDMRYFPEAPIASSFACLGAPTPVPNPQHPLKVRDLQTPLLLVAAVHDPTSGYAWATSVARQLGRNGVLLTYDGWGHGLYRSRPARGSECVDDAIERYLLTQTLPEPGTHCPAVEPA
jgi:pimeloyl-ACP methyl ester carboxylesterase